MSAHWPALLLIAIGIAAFGYLWQQAQTAATASAWPSSVGRIVVSELETRPRRGGGDSSGQQEYRARLRYRYQVAGQDYQAERRRFPDPGFGGSAEQAQQVLDRYPLDSQVQVYYNPANPAAACLEPGGHWSVWAGKAIALCFVAAGVLLLLKR